MLRIIPFQTDPAGILSATADVLTEAEIVEQHFHTRERWCGVSGAPDEIDAADFDIEDYFEVITGTADWGTAICVLGSGDTPVFTGMTLFDLHRIVVADVQRNVPHRVRIAWGANYAAGVAANNYSDVIIAFNGTADDRGPRNLKGPRLAAGTKVWVNARGGAVAGYFRFFLGIHEYLV